MLSDWLLGNELAAGGGKDEGKTPASIIKVINTYLELLLVLAAE